MARQRRDSASQIAARLGFDPFKCLVRQAVALEKKDPHSKELRDLCLELAPFCVPRLKAVEHDIAVQGEVTVVIGGQGQSPNEVIEGDVVELKAVSDE